MVQIFLGNQKREAGQLLKELIAQNFMSKLPATPSMLLAGNPNCR